MMKDDTINNSETSSNVVDSMVSKPFSSNKTSFVNKAFNEENEVTNGRGKHQQQRVHSVLIASELHIDVDHTSLHVLPSRHDGGIKSSLAWYGTLCKAGLGMFIEAFVIISTGQIKTIWHQQYPTCWLGGEDVYCPNNIVCGDLFLNQSPLLLGTSGEGYCEADGTYPDHILCTEAVKSCVSWSEFAGIMIGMLSFGYIADWVGRKNAGILTSLCMMIGIFVMTFIDMYNTQTLFIIWAIFFGIFGLGVGGEYPLTASGAAEHHVKKIENHSNNSNNDSSNDDDDIEKKEEIEKKHNMAKAARRGETITIIFAMQGVGAVFGSLVILCLLYFSKQGSVTCTDAASNEQGNNPQALDAVWRSFYFIATIFVMMLLTYRFFFSEESIAFQKVQQRRERREKRLGRHPTWKIMAFYAPTLLGTAGCWFLWDIAFYGIKLFSGPIFSQLNPSGNLMIVNGYILLSNAVALVGYYCSALVIDQKRIGRTKLQVTSFFVTGVLYIILGSTFQIAPTWVTLLLLFLASFSGNFGANVTTYVVAAESYPTELRSTCHGLSAFSGKVGALLATIIFGFLNTKQILYTAGIACIIALLFSIVFSQDLTHVSLAEHDAQLELFLEGTPNKYKGSLNKKEHLSLYQKWTGHHGTYDPNWKSMLLLQARNDHHLATNNKPSTHHERQITVETVDSEL